MPLSVILQTHLRTGQVGVARDARGKATWPDHKSAEAEASRMRFRDEASCYCVFTNIFADLRQAEHYARLCNAGHSPTKAIHIANPNFPKGY